MPDYQKGKIYKLYSISNEELVYYGSTIETLSSRLSKHIYEYKNKPSCESKLVLAAGDYKMELIENYPCANKQQLERKECEYIKANKCVNIMNPCRTRKEYYQDNKEVILNKLKEYRENNKEKIAEYNKQRNEANKEKIAERKKKYWEDNKEKLAEHRKEYREKNKQKIAERKKEKVTCECGCIIRKSGLARHKQTNKHINALI
ncbi:MAG: DUF1682 domain-containing protein [Aestuariibacter sp.]|nr:DUF1682 domain-containing protein [Aestuariibacter sp.]